MMDDFSTDDEDYDLEILANANELNTKTWRLEKPPEGVIRRFRRKLRKLKAFYDPNKRRGLNANAKHDVGGGGGGSDGDGVQKTKIYISYCYQMRKEAIFRLVSNLKQQIDFDIWIDMEHPNGPDEETMTKAIDEAYIVLCFYSRQYAESPNCRRELQYAASKDKEILPIRVQRYFRLDDDLFTLTSKSPERLDYTENDTIHETAPKICRYIRFLQTMEAAKEAQVVEQKATILNFKNVGIPIFSKSKYFTRNFDEERILQQIKNVAKGANDNKCFVISGNSGVGKTTLFAHLLIDEANRRFLVNDCNINRAIWINCIQWQNEKRQFDEKAFINKVLSLAKQLEEPDPSAIFTSLHSLEAYFKKKELRVVYIFDDLTNHWLLDFFLKKQTERPLCFVITSDKDSIVKTFRPVPTVEPLEAMTNDITKKMLEKTFKLDDYLNEEQVKKLARVCAGVPLIANFVATRITSCGDYKEAAKECKLLAYQNKGMANSLEMVSYLFTQCFDRLEENFRTVYYAFLFFNPGEPVSIFDLGILWGFELDELSMCGVRGVCRTFEKQTLIRRVKRLVIEKTERKDTDETTVDDATEDRFLVHEILYKHALERAKSEYDIDGDTDEECLAKIRLKIINGEMAAADIWKTFSAGSAGGSTSELSVLLAILKYQRSQLLERIIEKMDAQVISDVCRRKSLASIGMPFVQFLYHFNKWEQLLTNNVDDVRPIKIQKAYKVNLSYRLIKNIFDKLVEFGGEDLLWRVVDERRENVAYSCLFMDIFDDEKNDICMIDRGSLLAHLKHLTPLYAEMKWEAKLRDPRSKTDPVVLTVLNSGEFDDATRQLVGQSAEKIRSQLTLVAARRGYLPIVTFLVERWPSCAKEVDDEGRVPIILAALNGHEDVVEYLYEKWPGCGKMVDFKGRSAMLWSAKHGHMNCVRFLYQRDPGSSKLQDIDGYTALTVAALGGYFDIVNFLAEHMLELLHVRVRDFAGSALSVSAGSGKLEVVKYLLPKYPSSEHAKALSAAAVTGQIEVIEYLYEKNSDNARTVDPVLEFSALMLAAGNGHLECVKFLYEKSPDFVTVNGEAKVTAIMTAATSGHLDIVQWLFYKDPSMARMESPGGDSAIGLAEKMGHREIAQFLRDTKT